MMESELLSFEEASRELGISEEELEQLVAAGEIASIKKGDTLVFKKSVVQKFKRSRQQSTPTILLSDDEIDLFEDGLEVEELEPEGAQETTTPLPGSEKAARSKEAAGKQAGAHKAPGAKAPEEAETPGGRVEIPLEEFEDIEIELRKGSEETEELEKAGAKAQAKAPPKKKSPSEEDTLLSLDGVLEDDLEGTTPVPSGLGGEETLLDTEELLGVEGLAGADPFAADTVEETAVAEPTESGTLLRSSAARVMRMKRKKSQAIWTIILAFAAVVLMLPLGVVTNLFSIHSPSLSRSGHAPVPTKDAYSWIMEYNVLDGAVEGIAELFASK